MCKAGFEPLWMLSCQPTFGDFSSFLELLAAFHVLTTLWDLLKERPQLKLQPTQPTVASLMAGRNAVTHRSWYSS